MWLTFRDTWGLRTGTVGLLHSTAIAAAAAIAAILPKEIRERLERAERGRVVRELAFAALGHEPALHESIEVVVERRPRRLDGLLDVRRGGTPGNGLHHVAQDGQPQRVAQGRHLRRVAFQRS